MKKLLKNKITKRILAIFLSVMIIVSVVYVSVECRSFVQIKDETKELSLTTYSNNTKRILSQADVQLEPSDTVKRKDKNGRIYIEVMRAFPVHIVYHNMEQVELMCCGSVKDALKNAGITLSEYDVMNFSSDEKVYDSMKIIIDEVKYITKTSVEEIKYKTKVKESDSYEVGYEHIESKGTKGEKEITATYTYVNGEFDSVVSESEKITKKPKDKVVVKGTAQVKEASNISFSQSSSNKNSVSTSHSGTIDGLSYKKVLTGSATAYTASSGALTSTGVPAYVGGVAVNPNIIPYGSKLYIVADGYTYGYATAVDTGGALMSGTALVDLYMSTYDECINFGRRNVKVYILN